MNIVLGITGSIAAYKAADLASQLVKAGHEVHAVLTRAATEFITPLTLQVLTRQPVLVTLEDEKQSWKPGHIELADQADLFVVAPASADTLGHFASGLAPDPLSSIYLALPRATPVILAPVIADVVNIFVPGTGIPIVMGILGALTLWAGLASWRRNAREGLHQHDRVPPRSNYVHTEAAGLPNSPEPTWGTGPDEPPASPAIEPPAAPTSEAPHRHRRRRRAWAGRAVGHGAHALRDARLRTARPLPGCRARAHQPHALHDRDEPRPLRHRDVRRARPSGDDVDGSARRSSTDRPAPRRR